MCQEYNIKVSFVHTSSILHGALGGSLFFKGDGGFYKYPPGPMHKTSRCMFYHADGYHHKKSFRYVPSFSLKSNYAPDVKCHLCTSSVVPSPVRQYLITFCGIIGSMKYTCLPYKKPERKLERS
jgi:hypothetical protein